MVLPRVSGIIYDPDRTKIRDGRDRGAHDEDRLQIESRDVRNEPRTCRSAVRFLMRGDYVYCIRDVWVALTGISWPSRG